MRAWIFEIEMYVNKKLKGYLSKIERENEKNKEQFQG
jgi:hypothetical protein